MQLPDAASLQRNDEVVKQAEEILKNTPGVKYYSSVVGYSMLSGVNNTYSAFFFITLRGLGRAQEAGGAIQGHHGAPEPASSARFPAPSASPFRRRPFPASALRAG